MTRLSLRKRFIGWALLTLWAPGSAWSQPPDTSFLREYSETRGFQLGRPQKARFSPDGRTVLFLRSGPKSKVQSLFEMSVETGQVREVASADALLKGQGETLSPEEKARRERLRLQASGFADYHLNSKGNVLLPLSGKLYLLERPSGALTPLPVAGPVLDAQWSPDGQKIAYVRGYDVYVYDLQKGTEAPVTRGGTAEVTHGIAEFVAQEEMRRLSGFWWSPDSRRLAIEEADHRGVEVWYISDPSKPDQPPQRQFYPRPGRKNVSARLGLVTLGEEAIKWVPTPRGMEYLGAVRWDKLGPLTVQWQDRSQKTLELHQVDPRRGSTHLLVRETDPAWVNLHQGLPLWLPAELGQEPRRFFFFRAREGFEKLCLVDASKGESTVVLPLPGSSPAEVSEFVSYDPLTHLLDCRVDAVPGSPRSLRVKVGEDGAASPVDEGDGGAGVTEMAVSKIGGLRLITRHSLEELPRTRLVGPAGQVLQTLPSVAIEPEIKVNFTFEPLRDESGALLYNAAVVRPKSFDAARKYPVVLEVYGGPHHLQVVQSRKNWLIDQWLADQGFIVVAVDNRGTPGRGIAWETSIQGKFGEIPLEDQVKGLALLSRRVPQMDTRRVGIVGWSFGGYLSAQAVLRRPDVFTAAIAGAPVTDWEDYDTHYTERYMGLLPQSRQAYDQASLLPLGRQLKRPLMLVHGTADDNVYYRNSLRLADALFRAGQPFELLSLPGITHSYSADANVTERLWVRNVEFFQRHLGRPQ